MVQLSAPKKFNEAETKFQGRFQAQVLDTLFQAYRPVLGRTIFMVVIGVVGRICLLGNANIVGYWVDAHSRAAPAFLEGYESADYLKLMVIATVIGMLLTFAFRVGISRLSVQVVSSIYDETTVRVSRLPTSFFDRNPAGRVMTRFTGDYFSLLRVFGGPLAEFLSLAFDLLAMSVLIVFASPMLLPFWGLLAALNFLVYRFSLDSLRKERRESALRRSPGIVHFAETASGATTIRAFGKQQSFIRRFEKLNDAFLNQKLRSQTAFTRFTLLMSFVTAFVLLVTGLASIWWVQNEIVTIGSVGVAFAYLGLSTAILNSFFDWLGQFQEAFAGLERMDEYLRMPLEPGAELPLRARFRTGHKLSGDFGAAVASSSWSHQKSWDGKTIGASIEIEDLWMRYRQDLPMILQGVTVTIKPGERVAVVGKTGSGKTSLIQALFRLYPLEKGNIRVAGVDTSVGLGQYRSLMSYITQEPTLLVGPMRMNLCLDGQRGEAELIQALRRVQFLRMDATDDEYCYWLDYKIEERGRNLSTGERQLVSMARCLLQDTPVVIFDEATSAVDPRSEEILTRATEEFFVGKTQIIIAHRLSTIRSCDRVLWLQNGKVHRVGDPAEVLKEFETAELDV